MFYSILKREWRGQTKKMNESILTSQQVKMAEESEPHEILFAIHKLMAGYRNHAKNLEIEIEMLKERVEKLEKIKGEEDDAWKAIYPINEV